MELELPVGGSGMQLLLVVTCLDLTWILSAMLRSSQSASEISHSFV